MNVALTADLERLLRKKVEDGQFPDEEAVVQEALRSFLVKDATQTFHRETSVGHTMNERIPGPFLEDDIDIGTFEVPRICPEAASFARLNPVRLPDRFPGE